MWRILYFIKSLDSKKQEAIDVVFI